MTGAARGLNVLAVDTSTESCSAAVLRRDGALTLRSTLTERSHAELILPMVEAVLAEAGLTLQELDGLAFGRGPGGFTGLRIAAGVVQGLAFGAGLRVAPVSSLAATAFAAVSVRAPGDRNGSVLVCNDARMNEVYWACYRFDPAAPEVPRATSPERVGPASSVEVAPDVSDFAGNGVARFPELRARLEAAGLQFRDGIYPRADAVARIGAGMLVRGEAVEPAAAVPTYVRDDVARPAGGPVTGMS
jgi:tRNA threonylcarbamoyladenosine biosynthesis protein TsaB